MGQHQWPKGVQRLRPRCVVRSPDDSLLGLIVWQLLHLAPRETSENFSLPTEEVEKPWKKCWKSKKKDGEHGKNPWKFDGQPFFPQLP